MDYGQERMRLAAVYTAMADGELEELAGDQESLTDPARRALKDEMARRGMEPTRRSAGEAVVEEVPLVDPVTVVEFCELSDALLARGLLASGGIPSVLLDPDGEPLDPDQQAGAFRWVLGNVAGAHAGIRLQVAAKDLRTAREVLEEPLEEKEEPE